MKKISFILAFVLTFLFIVNPSYAENFFIKNYKVKMQVSNDRVVNVDEEIQVYFTNPSHGLIRDVSKKGRDSIKKISATELVSASCSATNCSIKMGNPNKTITGDKTYRISYNYDIKSDKNEFYYNIIGTNWDTTINMVDFEVVMPSKFDPKKAGISIGKYGTKGFDGGAYFSVNGTTIKGMTTKPLNPNEGVTLRIEVPNDYFSDVENNDIFFALTILIIATLMSFFFWLKFGKDDRVVQVVSFSAPKNLNPVEAEIVYKGKATTSGLVSLIVYLASKGYIGIDTSDKDSFVLHKTKHFEGLKNEERIFARAIFGRDKVANQKQLETSETFYKKCSEIVDEYNKKRTDVYEESSIDIFQQAFSLLCLITAIVATLAVVFDFNLGLIIENGFIAIFPIVAIFIVIAGLGRKRSTFSKIYLIIFALCFGGIPLLSMLNSFDDLVENPWYALLGLVCIIICSICFYHLPKRNKTGVELQGELLGLKKFIETAEKHRLETMVKDDPSYFYSILPFAYILGVSNVWIEQFESIMNTADYDKHYIDANAFNNFANSFGGCTLPSHANGGISSSSSGGGGFSGGGSGGGGGSSW